MGLSKFLSARFYSVVGVLSFLVLIVGGLGPSVSSANLNIVRWTGAEDRNGEFRHVLSRINLRLGTQFGENDFLLSESRSLAYSRYRRYQQLAAGTPVLNKNIRLWLSESGELIQIEANLDIHATIQLRNFMTTRGTLVNSLSVIPDRFLSDFETRRLSLNLVKSSEDATVRGVEWKDYWNEGRFVRVVKVRSKRGIHTIHIDLDSKRILKNSYKGFPQVGEFSVPAMVYPIYEEVETDSGTQGGVLPRIQAELRYIFSSIPDAGADPFAPLRTRSYLYSKLDPIRGETSEGRALGYWSTNYLNRWAIQLMSSRGRVENDFSSPRGALLRGRYATINIHPDAVHRWGSQMVFQSVASSDLYLLWRQLPTPNGSEEYEISPSHGFTGKPLQNRGEAFARTARRDSRHNPITYINDGFDEVQVYYAINTLMDSLHTRGFTDPELSTRPFTAYLYDPDLSMKNNAYYFNDTINFSTYSPQTLNYARDNSTIWHELGHGIMDRLMGSELHLADSGGLSEGMADFIAQLVISDKMGGQTFPGSDLSRIINSVGFNLTNEEHDDGEAYGGAMRDFLMAAMAQYGDSAGLHKVTDLIFEAMRLTRDHPALDASVWFSHVVFADQLGRPGLRAPGELSHLLTRSLSGRNFRLDGGSVADFNVLNLTRGEVLSSSAPGSRYNVLSHRLQPSETVKYDLRLKLISSSDFSFQYPARVVLQFQGGPLQGAIRWIGEQNGSREFAVNAEGEVINTDVVASGTCDFVNREDGGCSDFVYLLVYDRTHPNRPIAKKRFYLKITNP